MGGQSNVLLRRLAKMFAYAGAEPQRRLVSYFWWSTERLRRGLYSPEFAERVASVDTAAPLLAAWSGFPPSVIRSSGCSTWKPGTSSPITT